MKRAGWSGITMVWLGCTVVSLGVLLTQVPALHRQQPLRCTVKMPHDLVYINIANAAELCVLPGIGEQRAKQIIAHRDVGGLHSIEQLADIKGIGRRLAQQLAGMVSFEQRQEPYKGGADKCRS